jgi:AcrR family transcriptional regulator
MVSKAIEQALRRSARPLIEQLRSDTGDEPAAPRWRGRGRAEQIVEVAMESFHRKGFNGTSMDDIAQAVGILKGSLYHYIDSKDDLLYLIVTQVRDDADAMTDVALAREDLSPLERVVHYVELQVNYNAHYPMQIAVYHHEWRRLSGENLVEMTRRRKDNAQQLREVLVESADAGELVEGLDLDLALRSVLGVPAWTYTWYQPGGAITPEYLATFCGSFVRRALTSHSAPDHDSVG